MDDYQKYEMNEPSGGGGKHSGGGNGCLIWLLLFPIIYYCEFSDILRNPVTVGSHEL